MELEKETAPLEGYRLYQFYPRMRQSLMLEGTYGKSWLTSELTASCDGSEELAKLHLSTGACRCGIYVVRDYKTHDYWSPKKLLGQTRYWATAKVTAWGVCFEAEIGVRCEHVAITEVNVIAPPCVICSYPSEYFGSPYALCNECREKALVVAPDVIEESHPFYCRWDHVIERLQRQYPELPINVQPLLDSNLQGETIPYPMPKGFEKKKFDFLSYQNVNVPLASQFQPYGVPSLKDILLNSLRNYFIS